MSTGAIQRRIVRQPKLPAKKLGQPVNFIGSSSSRLFFQLSWSVYALHYKMTKERDRKKRKRLSEAAKARHREAAVIMPTKDGVLLTLPVRERTP